MKPGRNPVGPLTREGGGLGQAPRRRGHGAHLAARIQTHRDAPGAPIDSQHHLNVAKAQHVSIGEAPSEQGQTLSLRRMKSRMRG